MKGARRLAVVLAATATTGLAYTQPYTIDPVQASWAGWSDTVGQGFVACFDSIEAVHLFIGYSGGEGEYVVNIGEPGGAPIMTSTPVATVRDHYWLEFEDWQTEARFTKGKTYIATFTQTSGLDSLMYYYDSTDAYEWGQIILPGQQAPTDDPRDLACRVHGVSRVDEVFGIQPVVAYCSLDCVPRDTANWEACIERQAEVGVEAAHCGYAWWIGVQPSEGTWNWEWIDSIMSYYAANGIQPTMHCDDACFWASSNNDPHGTAIARGLFYGWQEDSNYTGRYFYELAYRYGPRGQFWAQRDDSQPYKPLMLYESRAEPTYAAIGKPWDTGGWWQLGVIDDTAYRSLIQRHIDQQGNTYDGRRSSFMEVNARRIVVIDSATKAAASDRGVPTDSYPRTAAYVVTFAPDRPNHSGEHYYTGEWLDGLEEYGAGGFFQVVSFHPYHRTVQEQAAFVQDTMRHYFRPGGLFGPLPLWQTEMGWPSVAAESIALDDEDPLRAIRLAQFYPQYQALNSTPGVPVVHSNWFVFTSRYLSDRRNPDNNKWYRRGITGCSTDFESLDPAFAYEQWSNQCQGASFIRSIEPVSEHDAHVYQFEDSSGMAFWIAWKPDTLYPNSAKLPATTDTLDVDSTSFGEVPAQEMMTCETDGWAEVGLEFRPVIVRERGSQSRPDVVVDSVQYVPAEMLPGPNPMLVAWVSNHGSRATPEDGTTQHPYSTWVVFKCDTTTVGEVEYDQVIAENEQVNVGIDLEEEPEGNSLYSARANPAQVYVELYGLDDNAGYVLKEEE